MCSLFWHQIHPSEWGLLHCPRWLCFRREIWLNISSIPRVSQNVNAWGTDTTHHPFLQISKPLRIIRTSGYTLTNCRTPKQLLAKIKSTQSSHSVWSVHCSVKLIKIKHMNHCFKIWLRWKKRLKALRRKPKN